jgi:polyribonucleotide nucleotidyltransferase
MQQKTFSLDIGGKTLTATFSDLADQAHGSVLLQYGNTVVLATAVIGPERTGIDYFPLTVDYEEKFYAAGQILGSRFMRREGRPSEDAILSGRVVDRTIRPLFDHRLRNEVQVVVTVLSIEEDDPDSLGVIAASLALGTSDIPWNGPVSAVRIGKHNGNDELKTWPTYAFRADTQTSLDMLVCGKDGLINMIEVGSREVPEPVLVLALEQAKIDLEKLQKFQTSIIAEIGKPKREITHKELPAQLKEVFDASLRPKFVETAFTGPGKAALHSLHEEFSARCTEQFPDIEPADVDTYFEEQVNEIIHSEAIDNDRRADGRPMDQVRPLFAQAGSFSPMLHGSGIFYRGGTHVFSALTLGGPGDSLIVDSIEEPETKKRFMHHYNFPPFSSGETGRMGGMNRRMIGHGALAEKALAAVIPPVTVFPYTIRLVSESMASNGSTSMASVCASTLALMDGGVPILRPVAGIAIGLMMRDHTTYKILTDIQGPEDHHGDMDFKVAGTKEGVTAVQMDVKVDGVPVSILAEAFEKAKQARLEILNVIEHAISAPRPDISPRAPRIVVMTIKREQIGAVIGPGGKIINGIREATKVDEITIEEDGTIFITGKGTSALDAQKAIEQLTHEYIAGETFEGEVVRITDFGAFVKIAEGTEGLVHVSEIAPFRIERVSDILKVGEKVPVIIKGIDEKDRISLSIKNVDPEFARRKGATPPTRPATPR